MKARTNFRKEPLIFLAALAALGASVANIVLTHPDALEAQSPLAKAEAARSTSDPIFSQPEELSAILQNDRETPFAPIKPPPPPTKKIAAKLEKIVPPPQVQPIPKKVELPPKDPRLTLSFMGIIRAEGGTMGLLRATEGSSVYRIRENDEIVASDTRYTAVKIDTRSIELRDESGHVWSLTDGLFEPRP